MNSRKIVAALAAALALALFTQAPAKAANGECGRASWYALQSRTASGEMMDPGKMTAAHPRLPFGTRVTVTNARNGRKVTVRINDRGPFVKGRIIDLSKAAAHRLGFVGAGHTKVCLSIS